jgi:hypothetical protein
VSPSSGTFDRIGKMGMLGRPDKRLVDGTEKARKFSSISVFFNVWEKDKACNAWTKKAKRKV